MYHVKSRNAKFIYRWFYNNVVRGEWDFYRKSLSHSFANSISIFAVISLLDLDFRLICSSYSKRVHQATHNRTSVCDSPENFERMKIHEENFWREPERIFARSFLCFFRLPCVLFCAYRRRCTFSTQNKYFTVLRWRSMWLHSFMKTSRGTIK
jgi:hypothetical protein